MRRIVPLALVAVATLAAPFAAAQVQVTSASVVGRRIGERGTGHACAASVAAVTGPDQGATRAG